jgi:excisionase family DNA binding protein
MPAWLRHRLAVTFARGFFAMETFAVRSSSSARKDPNSILPYSTLPMLTPTHAWRLLCRRTGGSISRTTFYRWINSGRVGAVRVGFRFLVPLPLLEEIIQKCLDGERI